MIFRKERANGKPRNKIVQIFTFVIKILFAIGVISWLISRNYDAFSKAMENFNFFWMIPAVMLYLLHLAVGAWRWNILLRVQKIKISFYEAFSLTMQAFFYSLVIPGGALGGDLAKVALIASRSPSGKKFEGSFTVLMDRFVGMMGRHRQPGKPKVGAPKHRAAVPRFPHHACLFLQQAVHAR